MKKFGSGVSKRRSRPIYKQKDKEREDKRTC